ncbi:MAG TPA: molybdenum cofactor guanylyltransferase MobA [Pseudomonas sp.]|nr:molybdenum cofactor guanylyltransferase MobA [Pseudomonas sp.]
MPMSPLLEPCSVLLLAGGRGQRMGGRDKGLLPWRDRPMIAWLHDVVRPLTDDLIISCNRNAERYRPCADRLVSDAEADFPGPLAGIRAGLAVARHPWLLVLPCDAPNVDSALLTSMRHAALPGRPLLLRQGTQWQPLFCLLPTSVQPELERAWREGQRSPRHILTALNAVALDCTEDDPRLANINSPDLLE